MIVYLLAKVLRKARLASLKRTHFGFDSKVEAGTSCSNVTFGDHSFAGYDCEIYDASIGSFCSIANNVLIGAPMHPYNWVSTSPVFYEGRDSVKTKYSNHSRGKKKTVMIANDVWIGKGAVIMPGVKIADGAVIGANAVVTKNVDAYSIVGGVPARHIKYRYNNEVLARMRKTRWWELERKDLKSIALYANDTEKFLDAYEKKGFNHL